MSLVSQLFDRALVLNILYENGFVKVIFKAIPWYANRIKGSVERLGGVYKTETKS